MINNKITFLSILEHIKILHLVKKYCNHVFSYYQNNNNKYKHFKKIIMWTN